MERVTIFDCITKEKLDDYAAKIKHSSCATVSKIRKEIFEIVSDDLLPKVSRWPEKYRRLFFKRPLGDGDTATMFWFLLGKFPNIK